jgi:BNR/Asp-box repeat.
LYAGTDTEGVVVSHDGGTTWARSGSGLSTILSPSGAVNTIAIARDGTRYAGTQVRGVAISRDEGATWQRLNNGLPDLDVRRIIVAGSGVFAMTAHCVVRLQTQ